MYDWADISDLDCPSEMFSWADISKIVPQTEVETKSTILVDNPKSMSSETQTDVYQSSTIVSNLEEDKKPISSLPEIKNCDNPEVFHCSIAEVSKVKRNRTKPDIYQSPTHFKVHKKHKKSSSQEYNSDSSQDTNSEDAAKSKRNRTKTEIYQSPTVLKNYTEPKRPLNISSKAAELDESIIFQKYEFLTVRNVDDGFYVCQTLQNVHNTPDRIKIRWLSQDENRPDLYYMDYEDEIELDCVLTNVNLNKVQKDRYQLSKYDLLRTQNLLKLSISKFKEE